MQFNTGPLSAEPNAFQKACAKKETAGKPPSPGGRVERTVLPLELVAQCKLHNARIGQQPGIVPEVAGVG